MVAAIAVAEDTGEGRAALEVGRDGGALKLNQNGQNANVRKLVLTVVLLLLLSFEKKYVCVESDCWDGRERVGFRTKVRVHVILKNIPNGNTTPELRWITFVPLSPSSEKGAGRRTCGL